MGEGIEVIKKGIETIDQVDVIKEISNATKAPEIIERMNVVKVLIEKIRSRLEELDKKDINTINKVLLVNLRHLTSIICTTKNLEPDFNGTREEKDSLLDFCYGITVIIEGINKVIKETVRK